MVNNTGWNRKNFGMMKTKFQQQQEKGQTRSAYHSLSQVHECQQEDQLKVPKVDHRCRCHPKPVQTPPTKQEEPKHACQDELNHRDEQGPLKQSALGRGRKNCRALQ